MTLLKEEKKKNMHTRTHTHLKKKKKKNGYPLEFFEEDENNLLLF